MNQNRLDTLMRKHLDYIDGKETGQPEPPLSSPYVQEILDALENLYRPTCPE